MNPESSGFSVDVCGEDGVDKHGVSKEELMADARGDSLRLYILESQHELLTAEEEKMLARALREGDASARERLITMNLRLVHSIARKYAWSGSALSDLIQEGNIGLMKAAEKFDPELGFRFSTYATWWIRQAVERGVQRFNNSIHIPEHVASIMRKIRRTEREYLKRHGREPSLEDLESILGMDKGEIERCRNIFTGMASFDDHGREGEDDRYESFVTSDEDSFENGYAQRRHAVTMSDRLLKLLDENQREIIERTHGLNGYPEQDIPEIAHDMGRTREWVRSKREFAYRKMRNLSGRILHN